MERIGELTQQLSQVVDQNAAAAQENAASCTELEQCAQDLREPWTAFHLSEYFKIRLDTLKAAIPPGPYWS